MFTGIIEDLGEVVGIDRGEQHARFAIQPTKQCDSVSLGDSITINGACLTVVQIEDNVFSFDVVYETLQKTALGALAIGDLVNMERSVPVDGRFDGHIVQGHVDGTGTIASIREIDNSFFIYINALSSITRYIVRKGSIAVDGISLTVVEADDRTFSVSIIPYTWEHTNLHARRAGDQVNLETDILARYIEKFVTAGDYGKLEPSNRSVDFMQSEEPARRKVAVLTELPSQ
jgi:riboflavin synthase